MPVTITAVEPGSAASRRGIESGEILLSIDGHEVNDVLDYRFYITVKNPVLTLQRPGGTTRRVRLRKSAFDDPGLEFESGLMDEQRHCRNRCVFCFIDQMPPGMRDTLYFKDDDSRMSFLFGNYITLTNLREGDIDRIIHMRMSPINISVHTMDPDLRCKMMHNPHAGEVLNYIPRLTRAGIRVNAQLVLCPGLNDGPALEQSLNVLTELSPALQSVAVVPVGLTKYRENLPALRLFDRAGAQNVLDTVTTYGNRMLEAHGMRICFAADEFYLLAGQPLPDADFYEDFSQLENGVGLCALLKDEFTAALADMPAQQLFRHVTIATGEAAAPLMRELAGLAQEQFDGLRICVAPIRNDFFGHTITVAGLVTGRDLIAQLRGRALGDRLLFPAVMLRHDRDRFLDDVTPEEVQTALGCPVRAVENSGEDLLDAILSAEE